MIILKYLMLWIDKANKYLKKALEYTMFEI